MVLTRVYWAALTLTLVCSAPARAERPSTRDALDRLGEVLQLRIDEGALSRADLGPAVLVSAQTRYEASAGWYPAAALAALSTVLSTQELRTCEPCMQPRMYAVPGKVEYISGALTLEEIRRLDDTARGKSPPARTAIWLDEHQTGVSIKIVELRTSRVLYADNIDPLLQENTDSQDMMSMSEELERRAKGDSLTHTFIDAVMFPSQHVSLDWTDQWGQGNENFTGVTLSLFDPILGVGLAYYRVIHVFRVAGYPVAPQVGLKVIMSLPTAIVQSVAPEDTEDLPDPLLRGMVVVRIPIGRSNYGLIATGALNLSNFGSAGLNPSFGLGISLLNISLIPVLP